MKRTILFTIIMVLYLSSGINAQPESDTVWTKDLWKFGDEITQVEFTPDGENIAVAIGIGVYIIDKLTGQFVKQFNKYMTSCNSFVIFEDMNWLVTTSDANRIIIWDYLTTDTVRMYNNVRLFSIKRYDENSIIGIGNSINEGGAEDSARIDVFDLNTGKIVKRQRPINSNLSYVYSLLETSKTSNLLALQSYDKKFHSNQVELLDLNSLEPIQTLAPGVEFINDLAFSNDGKYLASAGSDGLINIWDLETRTLIKSLTHISMEDGYLNVKFSPNSGYLVSSGGIGTDFTTQVWDLKNDNSIYKYTTPLGGGSGLTISLDSNLIATALGYRLILLNSHWSPTEIKEQQIEELKVLYPNPANNSIIIPIEENKIPISVIIYSIAGDIVKDKRHLQLSDYNIEIDISNLMQGVYIVKVIYEEETESYKFEKIN